ncbi:Titin [Labeo rohita]|uniref:Titin n=1 Tax=Labeo rohita TaxID=84645 RepID=A0ABQ8LFD7_LABRO|nr:Titin [Labeo rohita]
MVLFLEDKNLGNTVLKHKYFFSQTVCVAGLNLEATEGDNVTIPLETAELDRADQVTITLKRENKKKLIAQYCCCAQRGDCNVLETPGVSLQVQEGTLILLDVSSRDSGFYEATIIVGNNVSKKNATLNVNSRKVTQQLMLIQRDEPLLSPGVKLITGL